MNVVMDEAAEVYVKDAKPRRELGEYRPYHRITTELMGIRQVVYC